MNHTVLMKDRNVWNETQTLEQLSLDNDIDQIDKIFENYILDAKYEKVTAAEVAAAQKHLTEVQRTDLDKALQGFDILFDNKLGLYPHKKINIELFPDSKPYHVRPYSVPMVHEEAFLKELKHLLDIGVLRKCGPTEWACPTFIIPKKDGRIRWISDLRELNKCIKRRQYPLPLIHDIVNRRKGYQYFTKIDLTMFYYNLELDEASKQLCTIVTPYGKYQYCRLAMGLKTAPDESQAIIEGILSDLGVDVYIDDIGIFSNDWDSHTSLIRKVLTRLQDNGLKVNPLKCEWGVKETNFLGHWLTPEGVKPWKKKIDAILQMEQPKNLTQLRSFLGAVTYYRNMWPRRSHLLAPLTQLTGKSV